MDYFFLVSFCLSLKRATFFDLADLLYNFVERLLYGVFLLVGEFLVSMVWRQFL